MFQCRMMAGAALTFIRFRKVKMRANAHTLHALLYRSFIIGYSLIIALRFSL